MGFLWGLLGIALLLAGAAGGAVVWFVASAGRIGLTAREKIGWASPCVVAALIGLCLILFK